MDSAGKALFYWNKVDRLDGPAWSAISPSSSPSWKLIPKVRRRWVTLPTGGKAQCPRSVHCKYTVRKWTVYLQCSEWAHLDYI